VISHGKTDRQVGHSYGAFWYTGGKAEITFFCNISLFTDNQWVKNEKLKLFSMRKAVILGFLWLFFDFSSLNNPQIHCF